MTAPIPKKWTEHEAFAEYRSRLENLKQHSTNANEANVRLKVIDEIVFDILDWNKSEVDAEKYVRDTGFADYIFVTGKHVAMVLEAKKSDISFTIPEGLFKPEPITFALLEKNVLARQAL